MSNLFSFQGKVYLAERSAAGKPLNPVWVGNAKLAAKFATETSEKNESFSGQRMSYGTLQKGKKAEITLTLDEWLPGNLALGLYATKIDVASGSVTSEVFPTVVVGDTLVLDKKFISNLVITDSATTPATVAPAKYELVSANAGLVKMLDVTGYTQPFKAAYSYEAAENLTIFTKTPTEKYLILDGVNTENDEPVQVELFRAKFSPLSQLDLITDDYGALELAGTCLFDTINAPKANMGGFGRVIQKPAV